MHPLDRLAMIFAGANLSDSDIAQLHDSMRTISVADFLRKVAEHRSGAQESTPVTRTGRRTHAHDADWTIGERVDALLKKEAGLSTADAVKYLSKKISDSGLIAASDLPPLSKKSFDKWVDRLAAVVPPKELLRFASLIRNEKAGNDHADWLGTGKVK